MGTDLTPPEEQSVLRAASLRPRRRFLLPFLVGFAATIVGCYWLVDFLELRYCQPFTFSESNKVHFFQKNVVDPDVVFVGSSQVLFGVMPEVFEQELEKLGSPVGRTHNLGVLAGDLAICKVLVRDVLKGPRKPRTIVLGILPHLMFEAVANEDRLYCYARPADLATLAWQGEISWRLAVGASFRGVENLIQYPLRYARRPDRKFRDDFLAASRGGYWLPGDASISRDAVFDKEWKRLVSRMGDPVVGSFSDACPAVQHLEDLLATAKSRGVELVVVLPPQHPDYIRVKLSSATIEQFDQWCRGFCAARSVAYLNMTEPQHYRDADFRDPLHLGAAGAVKWSRRLAAALASPAPYPASPAAPPAMARQPDPAFVR